MITHIEATRFYYGYYRQNEQEGGPPRFHAVERPELPPGEYLVTFDGDEVRSYQEGEFMLFYNHPARTTRAFVGSVEHRLSEECQLIVRERRVGL
jgi:hypothetical protein